MSELVARYEYQLRGLFGFWNERKFYIIIKSSLLCFAYGWRSFSCLVVRWVLVWYGVKGWMGDGRVYSWGFGRLGGLEVRRLGW